MFESEYDQVICKNKYELLYVINIAVFKLNKIGLHDLTISSLNCYPINLFLFHRNIGWSELQDRIGNKYSFEDFVKWEQRI